jgi:hypothetical protein
LYIVFVTLNVVSEKAIIVAIFMSEKVGAPPPSIQSRTSGKCWLTWPACASVSFKEVAIGPLKGGRLAPRAHLQMPPLPVLAGPRHAVDAPRELIGNTLLLPEQAKALRIREGRRQRKKAKAISHGIILASRVQRGQTRLGSSAATAA